MGKRLTTFDVDVAEVVHDTLHAMVADACDGVWIPDLVDGLKAEPHIIHDALRHLASMGLVELHFDREARRLDAETKAKMLPGPKIVSTGERTWLGFVMLDAVFRRCCQLGISSRLWALHAELGRIEWPGTAELAEQQAAHYGVPFRKVNYPGLKAGAL